MASTTKALKKAAKTAKKKSAPKKSAKKSAGKHGEKHHETKDLRRAYEHMGRVGALGKTLKPAAAEATGALAKLAQKAIESGSNKNAAELLRASEHLAFAALAGESNGVGPISDELEQSILEHFDVLMQKASDHWDEQRIQGSGTLATLYQSSRKSAVKALKLGAYHQALEFARAAEALSHVKQDDKPKLEKGKSRLQLKSA